MSNENWDIEDVLPDPEAFYVNTPADRLVDEILCAVREAIYRRALEYAKGPTLTGGDVCETCRLLFIERRWPQDLIDLVT